MITFRAPNGTPYTQVQADAAHLAAMMATVIDDADLCMERRAVCGEGYRVEDDARPAEVESGKRIKGDDYVSI